MIEPINETVKIKKAKARMASESWKSELKNEIYTWSIMSHVDCYPKIFHAETLTAKCIWTALLFIFTGLTATLVTLNITGFFNYEVVTKIEDFHQVPTEFPTVTVCDSNAFSTKEAQDLITDIMLKEFKEDIFNMSFMEAYRLLPTLYELTKMYVVSPDYPKANLTSLGFKYLPFWDCQFNGITCNYTRDFRYYYTYNYGNCWQFNSGFDFYGNVVPLKTTTLEDQNFGLTLLLGLSNLNKYPLSDSKGIRLYVHNRTFLPINTEGFFLKPGEKTTIALKKTFYYNYPYPYSECQDLTSFKSELFTFTVNEYKNYRRFDCLNMCLQKNIIEYCDCYYTRFVNLYNNSRPCLNLTDYYCISEQKQALTGENISKCEVECPLECDTISYEMQLSSLEFPSQEFYMLLSQNQTYLRLVEVALQNDLSTYAIFKDNCLGFSVFYPKTEYTEVTVLPKILPIDLLSQIGGSLGMFLGFSMFHLIELFEIGFLIIYILYFKK